MIYFNTKSSSQVFTPIGQLVLFLDHFFKIRDCIKIVNIKIQTYPLLIEIGQLDQYCSFKTVSNDLNFLGVLGKLDANKSCVLYVRRARKAKL